MRAYSAQQVHAFTSSVHQPLQIIACPGSGKTTSLLARVHYILNVMTDLQFEPPAKLIILSFCKSSVKEISGRIKADKRFFRTLPFILPSTFHGLCYHINREFRLRNGLESPKIISKKLSLTIIAVQIIT